MQQGQALVEYMLLVLIFASMLLAVSKVLMNGFGDAYGTYKTTVEIPLPY